MLNSIFHFVHSPCAHTCFTCAAIAAALLRLKAPVALSENVHNELPRRGAGNGKRTWLSPIKIIIIIINHESQPLS